MEFRAAGCGRRRSRVAGGAVSRSPNISPTSTFTRIYGALSAPLVLLLWFYCIGSIFLFGAEYSIAWPDRTFRGRSRRSRWSMFERCSLRRASRTCLRLLVARVRGGGRAAESAASDSGPGDPRPSVQTPVVMVYPFDVQTGADPQIGMAIAQILAQEMAAAGGINVPPVPQGVKRADFLSQRARRARRLLHQRLRDARSAIARRSSSRWSASTAA